MTVALWILAGFGVVSILGLAVVGALAIYIAHGLANGALE